MHESPILDVARDWSFWDRPPPATVRREIALPERLEHSLALVLQGVRRCGKSTLMRQLMEYYGLSPEACAFVNFEDPRLARSLDWPLLDALVTTFRAARPGTDRLTFFLDEIQNVSGWERWLRSQLDRPSDHRFVVTGSNASLLAGELGAVLTGRHRTLELFPFTGREYAALRPGGTVLDYLHEGGFPEPLGLAPRDADALRRQYFLDIVERDVRERVQARSSGPVRQIAQMVYESAGSELSLRRVAASAGIAVETAGRYLDACESAYLIASVPYFAYSERKRAAHHRKYYPIDTGLRRTVVTPGSPDLGKSLECAVYLALRRRSANISYWRAPGPEGMEVDFVVQEGTQVTPYQVTLDAPLPRHDRALERFYEQFPHAGEAVTVTLAAFAEWVGLPTGPSVRTG